MLPAARKQFPAEVANDPCVAAAIRQPPDGSHRSVVGTLLAIRTVDAPGAVHSHQNGFHVPIRRGSTWVSA
jgi:hypothetical protein